MFSFYCSDYPGIEYRYFISADSLILLFSEAPVRKILNIECIYFYFGLT